MKDIGKELEDSIPATGYIGFNIKARNTEENRAVHEAFREFCNVECDGHYTLGLRRLIETYQQTVKEEGLWNVILELREEIEHIKLQLQEQPKAQVKEEKGTF